MNHLASALRALSICLFLVLPLLALSSSAQSDRGAGKRRGGGPPREAMKSCSSVSEGGACNFQGRRGEALQGTCQTKREALVCVPAGHESGERRERPERAE